MKRRDVFSMLVAAFVARFTALGKNNAHRKSNAWERVGESKELKARIVFYDGGSYLFRFSAQGQAKDSWIDLQDRCELLVGDEFSFVIDPNALKAHGIEVDEAFCRLRECFERTELLAS